MLTQSKVDAHEALEQLNANGHVVLPNLISKDMVTDLRDRVERILAYEREHPVDPGTCSVEVDQAEEVNFDMWRIDDDEIGRMKNRIRQRQAEEFDTPWPVGVDDVCISFIHIPRSSTTIDHNASSTSSTKTSPSLRSWSIRPCLRCWTRRWVAMRWCST